MTSKRTPGPYLREDRTIYALEHAGWRKGKELFQNRFYAGFQGGPNTPKEEVEATAAYFQVAANNFDALVKALEESLTLIPTYIRNTKNEQFHNKVETLLAKIKSEGYQPKEGE